MGEFLRQLFWPLLLYAALFRALIHRGRAEEALAALAAACAGIICAWAMRVFIHLPDRGLHFPASMDLRRWPAEQRRIFARLCLAIALIAAICVLAAFLPLN